jgi:very-short-patch-repair endonuclease
VSGERSPFPLEGGRAGDGGGKHRPERIVQKVKNARRLRREMTLPEKRLWAELRGTPLHVRRQVPIGRYVADFAILSERLIIEVDGPRHTLQEDKLHDAARDAWFAAEGFRTIRFTNARVLDDVDGVLSDIQSALQAAARPTPIPGPSPLEGEGGR